MSEPGRSWPRTLEALNDTATHVAVVVAISERSWWHRPQGLEYPGGSWNAVPLTATNYRVERVVRGEWPTVVQTTQQGARPGDYPCSQWAYEIVNNPLPKVGVRYVLFLQEGMKTFWGVADRFPVVAGTVHSEPADLAVQIAPQTLEGFLDRVDG